MSVVAATADNHCVRATRECNQRDTPGDPAHDRATRHITGLHTTRRCRGWSRRGLRGHSSRSRRRDWSRSRRRSRLGHRHRLTVIVDVLMGTNNFTAHRDRLECHQVLPGIPGRHREHHLGRAGLGLRSELGRRLDPGRLTRHLIHHLAHNLVRLTRYRIMVGNRVDNRAALGHHHVIAISLIQRRGLQVGGREGRVGRGRQAHREPRHQDALRTTLGGSPVPQGGGRHRRRGVHIRGA